MKTRLTAITQPLVEYNGFKLNAEEYIIWCARVSNPSNRLNNETAPKLLNYLIKASHWSPFEMVSIGIEITTSRAIGTQILRHRSFSFQEFSQRYSEVEDMEAIELRKQAEQNRQSSTDLMSSSELESLVGECISNCQSVYGQLLKQGVAKECARMVLPLTTETTICMHGTLRSWIHFLNQRCDGHAQKEIREIACEIRNTLAKEFPWLSIALNWRK